MARVTMLYSGSSGNSIFVGDGGSGILVDVGKNCKQTLIALGDADIDYRTIKGIFVTHEHSDHINGVDVLARKLDIPVYASLETAKVLESTGKIKPAVKLNVISGSVSSLLDMEITPFDTPHDSAGCVGYNIILPSGKKITIATDLGHVNDEIILAFKGSSVAVVESNYAQRMLDIGPYPYFLKQRIKGDFGHLSNDQCGALVKELVLSGTSRFLLAHLSSENNNRDVAMLTAKSYINDTDACEGIDYTLNTARRHIVSESIIF